MIGSDLEADAELITQSSGLSAASVNIHGDKDYLYGISVTLEAMGKLLLQKQAPIANTVNLLGCNVVDWHKETLPTVERLVEMAGFIVLSRWGLKETTKNLLESLQRIRELGGKCIWSSFGPLHGGTIRDSLHSRRSFW